MTKTSVLSKEQLTDRGMSRIETGYRQLFHVYEYNSKGGKLMRFVTVSSLLKTCGKTAQSHITALMNKLGCVKPVRNVNGMRLMAVGDAADIFHAYLDTVKKRRPTVANGGIIVPADDREYFQGVGGAAIPGLNGKAFEYVNTAPKVGDPQIDMVTVRSMLNACAVQPAGSIKALPDYIRPATYGLYLVCTPDGIIRGRALMPLADAEKLVKKYGSPAATPPPRRYSRRSQYGISESATIGKKSVRRKKSRKIVDNTPDLPGINDEPAPVPVPADSAKVDKAVDKRLKQMKSEIARLNDSLVAKDAELESLRRTKTSFDGKLDRMPRLVAREVLHDLLSVSRSAPAVPADDKEHNSPAFQVTRASTEEEAALIKDIRYNVTSRGGIWGNAIHTTDNSSCIDRVWNDLYDRYNEAYQVDIRSIQMLLRINTGSEVTTLQTVRLLGGLPGLLSIAKNLPIYGPVDHQVPSDQQAMNGYGATS